MTCIQITVYFVWRYLLVNHPISLENSSVTYPEANSCRTFYRCKDFLHRIRDLSGSQDFLEPHILTHYAACMDRLLPESGSGKLKQYCETQSGSGEWAWWINWLGVCSNHTDELHADTNVCVMPVGQINLKSYAKWIKMKLDLSLGECRKLCILTQVYHTNSASSANKPQKCLTCFFCIVSCDFLLWISGKYCLADAEQHRTAAATLWYVRGQSI